jgi:hypothetical protein
MSTTTKLYDYSFSSAKTYLYAALFVAGNLILPQLAHFVPNGGPTFLPIYFFTLIAAYKYGIKTGLLTAVLSPVINSLLFGMPMMAMMPIILIKSSLLAIAAAYAAQKITSLRGVTLRSKLNVPSLRGAKRRSNPLIVRTPLLITLLAIVLSYQIVGTLIEWAIVKDFFIAVQDFRIGLPGMALQVVGGWLILRSMTGR